ncbi:MAG: class II glutamine amidotransferase [Gammaproteobacteria bacterium]
MCRILYARAEADFAISELLAPFAELSRHSSEFQGHGWGCAWREGGSWRQYHDIRPIWEDDLSQFGSTRLLLVHARSAFRDEGIVVENNMPFSDGESVFIFNGELRGVRIRSEGRIGAEKIYNYIRRFDKGDKCAATAKAVDIIKKRSTYVRAMNLILSDGVQSCLSTNYSENTGYFQMHQKQDGALHLVCSEPFAGDRGWTRIENNTTIAL